MAAWPLHWLAVFDSFATAQFFSFEGGANPLLQDSTDLRGSLGKRSDMGLVTVTSLRVSPRLLSFPHRLQVLAETAAFMAAE